MRANQLFVYELWRCPFFYLSCGKLKIMHTFDNIKTLAVGATGVGAVEITSVISEATTSDGANIVQVVIQIIIGIATLIGMFKKKNTNIKK